MTQTMKGQNNTPQKRGRPGQRQQERLLRQGRRRRRIRQWTAAIVALVLIVLGVVGVIEYQQYTAAQTAAANKIKDQHATATARVQATSSAIAGATATSVANATATVQARASATAFAQAIRTATAGSPTPSAGPASPPPVTGTPVKLPDGLQYLDIKVGPSLSPNREALFRWSIPAGYRATAKSLIAPMIGEASPLLSARSDRPRLFRAGTKGLSGYELVERAA